MNRQIYFAQCGQRIKVGIASDIKKRLGQLRTGAAAPVTLIAAVKGDEHLERSLHRELLEYRVDGEWFHDCPNVRAAIDRCTASFDVGTDIPKKVRRESKFGAVCKLLWPHKTAIHIAAIGGANERTAWRWLSGETEPPSSVLAAIVVEITKR